jgi:hypothetical protein
MCGYSFFFDNGNISFKGYADYLQAGEVGKHKHACNTGRTVGRRRTQMEIGDGESG